MSEIVFLIEEALEGGYTARALGYSIYTEGDALVCHFEDEQTPNYHSST